MNKFFLIFRFLFDKQIPLKEKWWIIIPLIYIISPVDLIPMPILGFSVLDDLLMLVYLMSIVSEKTKKYYGNEKSTKENLKEKDIIENVEYEIDDDEDLK
ncbi:hypothetical protein [Sedimentibacter sp.]|uniref:hypothetical protein n=1 Tax=Sedimentibacter sp. TaxID=1960295 RepID=UPI00289CAAF1|nr:hypothetical protein [Sedimentibacter sp.]